MLLAMALRNGSNERLAEVGLSHFGQMVPNALFAVQMLDRQCDSSGCKRAGQLMVPSTPYRFPQRRISAPSPTLEIILADRLAAVPPLSALTPILGDAALDQQFLVVGMGA
jgi:hypothetical protein